MTDRCELGVRREQDWSAAETSCEPNAEQKAAAEDGREATATREAEARRDAYIASGADEGGRSRNGTSDASTLQPWSSDNQFLRNRAIYERSKDEPRVESDPYGNAIVAGIAGGALAGIEAASGRAGLQALAGGGARMTNAANLEAMQLEARGGEALVRAALPSAAKRIAKSEALNVAVDLYRSAGDPTVSSKAAPSSNSSAASSIGEGGETTSTGASRVSPGPNRSEGPRIPEMLPANLPIKG